MTMAGTTSWVLGLTKVNAFDDQGAASWSTVATVTGPAGAWAGAAVWTGTGGASWAVGSASPLGLVFAPRTGRMRQTMTPTMAMVPSTRMSRMFLEEAAAGGGVLMTPGM